MSVVMKEENHVNVGGLVVCKKLLADKSYGYRWLREDFICQSNLMFKFSRWIKENIFFIQQWTPVDKDEFNLILMAEFDHRVKEVDDDGC